MQIRDMFKKKIDREIEGVVKIGQEDDARVRQELDEYVVTNELAGHLSRFFSTYKDSIHHPTEKIGVWISGFFGSGKSHFLKILSYLVENREVDGRHAVDFFEDKINDPIVLADMKRAANGDTDVILFDIDAKSESSIKTKKDAVVNVLNKVFNEKQGFCGSIPWIADLERQMTLDGKYDDFRKVFHEISGRAWEEARDDFYYEEDAIIKALSRSTQMSETSARGWFDHAENDYTISIDRFAKRVKEYIDRKGNDHHVVFFIDEVGQYIGDNSSAMLNLQTIVQELGRQCHGQAWVVVTSQEDIDSVVKVKGDDFSKIMGRFTRLSLSSAFVDEVIKKRILEKTPKAALLLNDVFESKESILKNLLTFSDKGAEMKKFRDAEEFVADYPFIPYQFNLLQHVFTGVRLHGASGKHLSEGERSLLSSFQETAVHYADREEGLLVPFSAFYDTIKGLLDSIITNVIVRASNNERLTPDDVDVLKLLFLIKYVKEVPANLENLATLMVRSIDEDKIDLKKKISVSLGRLIHETLVQRNGEEYVFLTNDEQDVNKEIKNMHVERSEVIQQIGEDLFHSIYPTKKYRYSAHYNFPFNTMIDDRPVGSQSAEIGLKVLTPDYDAENDLNDMQLKAMSMRENNVILHMPAETDYLDEMEEVLKIQAYLRLKSGISVSQTIEDIKTRKTREVTDRKNRITLSLNNALETADIYVYGEPLAIKEKNPVDRINEAFHSLIRNLYHKIDYVTKFTENKEELLQLLKHPEEQMTAFDEDVPNHLALQEVDAYISRMAARHEDVTVKSVIRYFAGKPFGWMDLDTEALLIRLFLGQSIKLLLDRVYLQPNDRQLADAFTRRDLIDRVIVAKREKISPVLLKAVKDLCQMLFDRSAVPTDEDGLMQAFKHLLNQELQHLNAMLNVYRDHTEYPGKDVVISGQQAMQSLAALGDAGTFYKQAYKLRNTFEDYADRIKDVKGFFGNQRDKFDSAYRLMKVYEKNRTYITESDLIETEKEIEHIIENTTPYGQIQKLPVLCDAFRDSFMNQIEKESKPVEKNIDHDYQDVLAELEKDPISKEKFATTFRQEFLDLKDRLLKADSIIEVIAGREESDRLKLRCMDQIEDEREQRVTVPVGPDPDNTGKPPVVKERQKKTKTISKHVIMRGTQTISSEADLDQFINELRKKLEAELDENTIIKLV
ncbi:BREX system P-loop protein BrxC [Sporolactobacillus vineae]|uniref:BREX system P-loop protein BrxC n=1 Tax=Sporolactobacillus vineae TaxID=444463 RepID=UPI0002892D4A|nr:BREX system P-loop protein BrxC [Sporolactobacillus vineae]